MLTWASISYVNSAWCDLNKNCTVLKLHDMCHNPKCKCQKQITFTPKQFQLQGGSIKSKLQKIFRGTKKDWDRFIRPGLKLATPLISAAVAARRILNQLKLQIIL